MFSRLYGAVVKTRNRLYEKKFLKSFSLGVPVVSIGNMTVGGTGKTPLVALIAEILAAKGEKVAVLSRGYGRTNPKQRVLISDEKKILTETETAGDEPFELAQKLLGKAVVIADADRASAGNWAREEFGITAFVLDDAFQHRRVKRTIDIVTIDATNPFGNGKLLPFGILREPLKNLKRADAIVITRTNLTSEILSLKAQIKEFNSTCPIFTTKNEAANLVELKDFHENLSNFNNSKFEIQRQKVRILAFCALGNPDNFFDQLRRENFNVVATEKFSDHYFYTQNDVAKLEAQAGKQNAEILLTTAKDAVKLKNLKFNLPCFVVESQMIFDDEINFEKWLSAKINRV